MVFLDSVTLTKSARLKSLPWTVSGLRDLNVFVGPNGFGKTTLLGALADLGKDSLYRKFHTEASYSRHPGHEGKVEVYELFYKDLANMKPDINMYSDPAFAAFDIFNTWRSAGERSFSQIDAIKDVEGSVVLVDEMDASLDWTHQTKFFKRLKRLSKLNQVFVATHSLVLCSFAKEVYDVKLRRWVTYDELKSLYLEGVKI